MNLRRTYRVIPPAEIVGLLLVAMVIEVAGVANAKYPMTSEIVTCLSFVAVSKLGWRLWSKWRNATQALSVALNELRRMERNEQR